MPTPTEVAWGLLEAHLSLSRELAAGNVVTVTAREIKRVTRREARLMMKFDNRSARPKEIADASIVPIENGLYAIVPGDAYKDIEPPHVKKVWRLPPHASRLVTLPWGGTPSSESQVLDMALASGILEDFLEEENPALTIRGRRRSPKFSFDFPLNAGGMATFEVDGVQVEVDAGIEGDHINLGEAKMGSSPDFNVRQLYYPMRMWQDLVPSKQARPFFVQYDSDKVLAMRLYEFDPTGNILGIRLVKAVDYVYEEAEEELALAIILSEAPPTTFTPPGPFPQADSLERVLDVVDAVAKGITTANAVAMRYGFVQRQASYYPSAAVFLGFVERHQTRLKLTELGEQFVSATRDGRRKLVLQQLASRPVFRDALEFMAANNGAVPDRAAVVSWLETKWTGDPLSGTTVGRRASTVRGWMAWVAEIMEEKNA